MEPLPLCGVHLTAYIVRYPLGIYRYPIGHDDLSNPQFPDDHGIRGIFAYSKLLSSILRYSIYQALRLGGKKLCFMKRISSPRRTSIYTTGLVI